MEWKEGYWLGVPESEIRKWNILEGDMTGRFAYYRCGFPAPKGASLDVLIAAGSRYRMWVNGQPVNSGSCKGDRFRQFYDRIDLTASLKEGENVLAVQVLYCDPYGAVKQTDERASIFAVVSPGGGHRLAVEGEILDGEGKRYGTVTTGKADWKVWLDGSFYLKSTKVTENLGAVCEEVDFRKIPSGWKKNGFCAEHWRKPVMLEKVRQDLFTESVGLLQRFPLRPREIPLMYERWDSFLSEKKTETGILDSGSLTMKPGEKREIILDAGTVKNGYPVFRFRGGKGAEVQITYFEKFVHSGKVIPRDDAEHGEVVGITDSVIPDGQDVTYEPFWYRTFRFLRIRVRNGVETLILEAPKFLRTGYPLRVGSEIRSSEKWVEEVWKMSVRTLENCMMETYMDCPYYEQMQFPMDTRLQAMFTYCVSADAGLARKALEDYHCSMIPEGLIQGKYPSAYPQIISTFSLHYIYMLQEFYEQTGETATVKKYLPDIDRILAYYDRKTGDDGLVGRLGYWEFVDWQPAWNEMGGIPAALEEGPSAIINLMYALALRDGAELNQIFGRKDTAEEYEKRRSRILSRVDELCWDEKRQMYREGPGFPQYTQHAQAWAVLNGLAYGDKARTVLRHAWEEEDVLRVTFSTSYEWFRALEKAGLYRMTEKDMELWKKLPAFGCTTCPETPGDTRSDCHGWSALPIYELVRIMAGISPEGAGWQKVRIRPHMEYVPDMEGEAATPKGTVYFSYHSEFGEGGEKRFIYKITLPEELEGVFSGENGEDSPMSGGRTYCFTETEKTG